MRTAPRRVGTVRLAAPREPLARRGALLLEDALHTASLGAADGGRLVLVRRLDVGVIHADRAPAAVALAVEGRFRDAEAFAVHGGDEAARFAPAVWFRDEAEAHAALAVRLARGEPVTAWYWRLAVRAWAPAQSRVDGLRAVLRSVTEARAGAAAVVSLVAELHAAGCLDALLAALAPVDGAALLLGCGWSAPALPLRVVRARLGAASSTNGDTGDAGRAGAASPAFGVAERRVIGDAWRSVLVRWAARWGEDDARTHWLAAAALADRAPSSLLDPHLPTRAQRTLAAALALPSDAKPMRADATHLRLSDPTSTLTAAAAPVSLDPSGSPRSSDSPELSAASEPVRGSASPESAMDSADVASAGRQALPGDRPRAPTLADGISVDAEARSLIPHTSASHRPTGSASTSSADAREVPARTTAAASPDVQPFADASPTTSVRASNVREAGPAGEVVAGDEGRTSPGMQAARDAAEAVASAGVSGDARVAGDTHTTPDAHAALARDVAHLASAPPSAERARGEAAARGDGAEAEAGRDVPEPATFDRPRETQAAGLLFLVPVLRQLGIAGLLRDHPHLAEAQLPARVLRRIARLAGVAADDSVLALFLVSPREPSPLGFEWPAVWEKGIAASGWTVRRGGDGAARAVLFDGTGRLPLAAWRGEMPERVALSASTETAAHLDARTDCALVVDAWTVAVRRWCRRYARMGLAAVVRRPGGIVATRTHVDLLLDHRRADVRVRRAGMDLDPGWVPWLGRVVQHHYLHGGLRG